MGWGVSSVSRLVEGQWDGSHRTSAERLPPPACSRLAFVPRALVPRSSGCLCLGTFGRGVRAWRAAALPVQARLDSDRLGSAPLRSI